MNDAKKSLANDPRWKIIDAYDDLIAIINAINEHHHVIEINVINANPRDVGENQDNIEREVRFANIALRSLQKNLQQLRDAIKIDIRNGYE